MTTNWNQQYRPRRVADLHLTSVRESLTALMSAAHFPQALLFAGPKGTGKTSVARIIGSMLNDPKNEKAVRERFFGEQSKQSLPLVEPATDTGLANAIYTGQSYVVQELDAASNRGIDDVRALKERSALPPAQGSISVFILDEVHMLTTEAFNALLKLLEEPPAHVVFVLATTELHKLPATIVSRCHVIRFQKATPAELQLPLKAIAADQKLTVSDDSLKLIARLADGSFRDAVKLLQQYAGQDSDSTGIASLTGSLGDEQLISLISSVVGTDAQGVLDQLDQLRQNGTDEQYFLSALIQFLHRDLLSAITDPKQAVYSEKVSRFFLAQLIGPEMLKPSPIPFLRLELTLLDLIDRANSKKSGGGTQQKPAIQAKKSVVLVEPESLSTLDSVTASLLEQTTLPESTVHDAASGPLGDGKLLCEKWQELITRATTFNYAYAALLRSAQPITGEDGRVSVRVFYDFHKEQLMQNKWRSFWDELMIELAGGLVRLECIVEKLDQTVLKQYNQPTSPASLEVLAVDALMH